MLQHRDEAAVSYDKPENIAVLLKHGANIDGGDSTPLHAAAAWGRVNITKQLIAAQASINPSNSDVSFNIIQTTQSCKHQSF